LSDEIKCPNLYYVNLDCHRPDIVMQRTFYELEDIRKYLDTSKYALNKLKFPVKWSSVKRDIKSDQYQENLMEDEYDSGDGKLSERFTHEGYLGSVDVYPNYIKKSDTIFQILSRINEIYEDEETSAENRIKVVEYDSVNAMLKLSRKPKSGRIYIKPSTYQVYRKIEALNSLKDTPRKHHRPIIRLLENKEKSYWPDFPLLSIDKWYILTKSENKIPGSDKQRNFVRQAISTPDFALLEGPPGTGKTTTICELIMQIVQRREKVLLCASTHVAVDNVLEQLNRNNFLEKEVIAVRIGDRSNVSEEVKHVQFDEKYRTEKKQIIDFLNNVDEKQRSESQNYLLDALQSDSSDSVITNIILESANLICGTTIGVLQHPEIHQNIKDTPALFDYIIVDEASKTTFQEFLVPALYAKRWIIVGDPKQLSPYVENFYIESNIDPLVDDESKQICINVFDSTKKNSKLILEENSEIIENYKKQAEALEVELVTAYQDKSTSFSAIPKALEVFGSDLIVGNKNGITQIEDFIPMDSILDEHNELLQAVTRRNNYWINRNFESLRRKQSWSQQISWRLRRFYEKRHLNEDRDFLLTEINNLLPKWELNDRTNNTENTNDVTEKQNNSISGLFYQLERVKAIAFPSILELLQLGIESIGNHSNYNCVLKDGFNSEDLQKRHELLEFQHRMHSEISEFPRVYIYKGKSLKNPSYIDSSRQWNCTNYSRRCVWINVKKGKKHSEFDYNEEEVKQVMIEVKRFIEWAKKDRSRVWEIAVLTFYRNQEYALRKELRKLFNNRSAYQIFTKKDWYVKLNLCTVDRFQGHEADIVFLSFVKTERIGFLDSLNRLNVSLTRARYQLVLIGNLSLFTGRRNHSALLKELAKLPYDLIIE